MKRIIFLLLAIMIFSPVFSQESSGVFLPSYQFPSLINPNNVKINHSMSFSTSINSNKQSLYESRYTNHIFMQLHPKVDLNIDLNFVNYGSASFDNHFNIESNGDNQSRILPEFSLEYRPFENTKIHIEFRQGNPINDYFRRERW